VNGDGYCFFASVEKAKGWKRGEAKRRIIQFLITASAPSDVQLPSIVGGIDGLEEVDISLLRSAYITKLMDPRHYGGEAEATRRSLQAPRPDEWSHRDGRLLRGGGCDEAETSIIT
jgi:hypothetical protein